MITLFRQVGKAHRKAIIGVVMEWPGRLVPGPGRVVPCTDSFYALVSHDGSSRAPTDYDIVVGVNGNEVTRVAALGSAVGLKWEPNPINWAATPQ